MGKLTWLGRALPIWSKLQRIFDPYFYLRKYRDVASARIHPFRHYLEYGATEQRKPRALFDPDYYLLGSPEARQSGEPAVLHFLRSTGANCANPHPLFDCASYVQVHPESTRDNPLLHYLCAPRPNAPGDALLLTIMDAEAVIAFTDSSVAGAVSVWEDDSGGMRFLAPPEQRPFFAAMKYDQLRAQR